MNDCPTDDVLARFLNGEATTDGGVAIHLGGCGSCQTRADRLLAWSERRPAVREAVSEDGRAFLRGLGDAALDTVLGDPGKRPGAPFKVGGELPKVHGYDLVEELGRGGMGVVYKAWQKGLSRLVALKMLSGHADPKHLLPRFRAEGAAIARMRHPNFVQVYEIGESPAGPYLALEYVEGGSLADRLDGAPQPLNAAVALIETLARAIHHAHQHGIVHRDLKPANILLASGGRESPEGAARAADSGGLRPPLADPMPKITDFGLAKWLGGAALLTESGSVLGTPSYMPPEQAEGRTRDIGRTSDVYSLGAILYELLTGRPPFRGETAVETAMQVVTQEPIPPEQLRPGLPSELSTICLKCLRKEPERRYAFAADLADDLERYRQGRPIHARPTGPVGRLVRWCRRHPVSALLCLALFLAVTGGVSAVTWAWRQAVANHHTARHEADLKEQALRREEGERLKASAEAAAKEEARRQEEAERRAKERALAQEEEALYGYAFALAHREWQANNLVEANKLLQRCSPRLRRWEWDYLSLLCNPPSLGPPLALGPDATFSGDGRFAAFRGFDAVNLRDLRAGAASRKFAIPPAGRFRHHSACFDARGERLAVCWAGEVRPGGMRQVGWHMQFGGVSALWKLDPGREAVVDVHDVRTGERLARFPPPTVCDRMAFGPDGTIACWCVDGVLQVRDIASGHAVPVRGPSGFPGSMTSAFTPDGRFLALATDDGKIQVFPLGPGQPVQAVSQHGPFVHALFSPDGRQLALTSEKGVVEVWERRDDQLLRRAGMHQPDCRQALFFPDGERLLIRGGTRTLRVWEIASQRVLFDVRGQLPEPVIQAALNDDGTRLAVVDEKHEVRWLAVNAGDQLRALPLSTVADSTAFSISPDGRLMVGEEAGGLVIRELPSARRTDCPVLPLRGPIHTQFSPDGRLLACRKPDNSVVLFDTATGQVRGSLPAVKTGEGLVESSPRLTAAVWPAAFSPDNRLFCILTTDFTLRVWDIAAARQLAQVDAESWDILSLHFAPDGKSLLVADRTSSAKRRDIGTQQLIYTLEIPRDRLITAAAYAPGDDLLALGDSVGEIYLRRASTGEKLAGWRGHVTAVKALALSHDGRRLASSDGASLRIWERATGRELLQIADTADQLRFTPDGSALVVVDFARRQVRIRASVR